MKHKTRYKMLHQYFFNENDQRHQNLVRLKRKVYLKFPLHCATAAQLQRDQGQYNVENTRGKVCYCAVLY